MADPYLATGDFKERARITDADQDGAIDAVLVSASRQIDNWCGRSFALTDGFEDRYYTVTGRSAGSLGDLYYGLDIDDLAELDQINTASGSGFYLTAWDPTDYILQAAQGVRAGAAPYGRIMPTYARGLSFPVGFQGVKITGRWGWGSPPAPVIDAVFLMANRLKSLWDAPFGVSGSGEMGQLMMATSLTPIIKEMIAPYRCLTV